MEMGFVIRSVNGTQQMPFIIIQGIEATFSFFIRYLGW